MPEKKHKTTTALKTKKTPDDGSVKQNEKKDNIIPANVDTGGAGATERVRANAGGGLNAEGTNVNYEGERRNG